MLNNIVDNLEQCGQHNIVQCCFYQARTGCAFFAVYHTHHSTAGKVIVYQSMGLRSIPHFASILLSALNPFNTHSALSKSSIYM